MYDDWHDETWAEDEWVDDEGEACEPLLMCPSCREAVHEDTQQCPFCGDWIIPVDPTGRTKRIIWTIAAVLLIVALLVITIR